MKHTDLRELARLQQPVKTKDGKGGEVVTYADVEDVWIKREPLSVRELLAAGVLQGVSYWRVWLWYRDDITSGWRLQFEDGTTAEIAGPPVDPDGQRRWLRMEVVAKG